MPLLQAQLYMSIAISKNITFPVEGSQPETEASLAIILAESPQYTRKGLGALKDSGIFNVVSPILPPNAQLCRDSSCLAGAG